MTSGGLAAVSSSFFAALYSAFGKYDVVHIHAEGPAFFCWLPKLFGKRVVVTIHGIDWQREKWQSGLGSKFIHQGEKNAVKYADEVIVLSKGVQDYFKETYDRETHFIPNGVNRPQIREAKLITDHFGLEKDSYILFLGRLVPEKGIRYLVEACAIACGDIPSVRHRVQHAWRYAWWTVLHSGKESTRKAVKIENNMIYWGKQD